MKFLTLIEHHNRLEKAQIEINLLPGIPQIHFLGLPDRQIRESFFRIKSAFKSSGFKFPINKQVIVNIKPNHLKKSSKGLELAVAVGLLELTQQRIFQLDFEKTIIYGELELNGNICRPIDLVNFETKDLVLTGFEKADIKSQFMAAHLKMANLTADIEEQRIDEKSQNENLIDHLQNQVFTKAESELLFLAATGRFHVLLSGPAGSGKTTLAKNFIHFLGASDQMRQTRKAISPHHSVTIGGFLGGGQSLYGGDIERVKNGVLILDELLEFNPQILEALRAPMMGGDLELSRAGVSRNISCDFQVLATTNLCPCGKWTPLNTTLSCRFSRQKCQRYLDRLSGPILDRFSLFYFYPAKNEVRLIKGNAVWNRIKTFQSSIDSMGASIGALTESIKIDSAEQVQFDYLYGQASMRRQNALLKVAAIFALEKGRKKIKIEDLKSAEHLTIETFQMLEAGIH